MAKCFLQPMACCPEYLPQAETMKAEKVSDDTYELLADLALASLVFSCTRKDPNGSFGFKNGLPFDH